MPESAPSYQEMLVQDYLLLMAELRGVPKSKRIATVIEAARSIGLLNWLTRPIATLSKGYRQRVGLCQAILHRPDVLILDEPTNGLDPLQILEIRELIKQLSKQSTVMLSTHILPEIEAVCDRVIILIDGELAKDSSLRDLLSTRTIAMSVSQEVTSVEEALCTIAGVRSATRVGKDAERAGYDRFSVACEGDLLPLPEIFRLARRESWDLGGVAPVVPRLEQVFQGLMIEHAEKSKESAGGGGAT
jgi:ABC-2 type transport system ATP-binding protein